jgi:hypothetical protein
MSCKKYITETKIVTQNGQVDSNCNTITFLNTGTNNVFVDGIRITPGTSFTILGQFDEMNIKTYSLTFAAPGSGSLTIIYKRYVR